MSAQALAAIRRCGPRKPDPRNSKKGRNLSYDDDDCDEDEYEGSDSEDDSKGQISLSITPSKGAWTQEVSARWKNADYCCIIMFDEEDDQNSVLLGRLQDDLFGWKIWGQAMVPNRGTFSRSQRQAMSRKMV